MTFRHFFGHDVVLLDGYGVYRAIKKRGSITVRKIARIKALRVIPRGKQRLTVYRALQVLQPENDRAQDFANVALARVLFAQSMIWLVETEIGFRRPRAIFYRTSAGQILAKG